MNREELLNKTKNCTPQLGWEYEYPSLFGKYGMTNTYGSKWIWFETENIPGYKVEAGCMPLTEAADNELLEMLVIANDYWLNKYRIWYDNSTKKSSKLDNFIGECERKYFGYDKDGYTDKTIDRVLNAVLEKLEEIGESI